LSTEATREQVWSYIYGLERLGIHLGLDRIRLLVEALGSPHESYRTIHVVGTNGKTSTTRFISSLLEARGLTVGAYVSPHLVSLAERQMVNSVPAGDDEFCDLVSRIRPVVGQVEKHIGDGEHLTQFEVLTAAAFLYFKERGCDVAVIEAGLGGRLDATSVIRSDVQVLTSIGREHTELLGDTLTGILREKAAVIPSGGRAIAGELSPELRAELKVVCVERGATCRFLGDEVVILTDPRADSFDVFGLHACYTDLRLQVLGGYQRSNAALAIGAVELFAETELDSNSVRRALATTSIPGRLEVISKRPLCIFDGSHNPSGMEETMRSLDQILERRRLIAVLSVLIDKDAPGMISHLAPRCDIIFATQSSSARALDADRLASLIAETCEGPEVFVDQDPRSAMLSAYRLASSNQVVLVTGSLTLISDLKRGLS